MRKSGTISGLTLAALCSAATVPQQDIASLEALIKAGQFTHVREALTSYVSAHPTSWQALYQLGYADFRLHRLQESVSALCRSIVIEKNFAESHKILAFDLNMLQHPDWAKKELERAIELDPNSFDSHYELGRLEYEEGSYASAVSELSRAQAIDPLSVRVYHNLGLAYAGTGNHPAAVESFEASLRLNAQQAAPSAWPLIDYGTYLNLQQQFDRARDLLKQAISIDPSWDKAYDELSKAYRGLGETADAIRSLQKAVTLNPHKAEFHYILSRLYTQMRQPDAARTELAEYEKARQATR